MKDEMHSTEMGAKCGRVSLALPIHRPRSPELLGAHEHKATGNPIGDVDIFASISTLQGTLQGTVSFISRRPSYSTKSTRSGRTPFVSNC